MLRDCRANGENLNSHNEAELRRQFEERQQETEHVYELLENKIQLLQEVSRASDVRAHKVSFISCPTALLPGIRLSSPCSPSHSSRVHSLGLLT